MVWPIVAAGGVIGNVVLTPLVELVALPLALAGLVLGDVGAPFDRALQVSAAAAICGTAEEDDDAGLRSEQLLPIMAPSPVPV